MGGLSDDSSGSSHGTDPIVAVADSVVARSASPRSGGKSSARRAAEQRQSSDSQKPFSDRLAAARAAALRAAGVPQRTAAASHVAAVESEPSPNTVKSGSAPDPMGKRVDDSDDLGFDYEDDFEGESDLDEELLGTPAATGAVQAPSSSTAAAWGTPIQRASPQAPDTEELFPDGDATPISSAAAMHARAVATLTTAMQFANHMPSPSSASSSSSSTGENRNATGTAATPSASKADSQLKRAVRPADSSVSEAADDVDISAEVDALNASWAKRIDAADSVEQIRAVELQELREMQVGAERVHCFVKCWFFIIIWVARPRHGHSLEYQRRRCSRTGRLGRQRHWQMNRGWRLQRCRRSVSQASLTVVLLLLKIRAPQRWLTHQHSMPFGTSTSKSWSNDCSLLVTRLSLKSIAATRPISKVCVRG